MAKSDDEVLTVAARLHRGTTRLNSVLLATRAKGMSMSKLALLGRLHREGTATASALAAYLRLQPQSLTRLVASLERRGFIARHPDAFDGRQMLIDITEEGKRALFGDMAERRKRLADAMERALSPAERGVLVFAAELMERIAEAVETAEAQPEQWRA